FAIWDARQRRLLLARDRLGKKPLYYSHDSRRMVFASEVRALLQAKDLLAEPDLTGIAAYLRAQCVPHPMTAFKGVLSLPPGHYLMCSADGTATLTRYWQPAVAVPEHEMSFEEARDEVLRILREAVRLRLIADVSVGALLSAGIDSGLVVALMAQLSD